VSTVAATCAFFANADMHYSYRHCGAPDDVIFTEALFRRHRLAIPAAIAAEMGQDHPSRAEATQADQEPHRRLDVQEPAGAKRPWQLIDAAGLPRAQDRRRAQVSEMQLQLSESISAAATATDIETLGETRAPARAARRPGVAP